jgi:hypothetical protein
MKTSDNNREAYNNKHKPSGSMTFFVLSFCFCFCSQCNDFFLLNLLNEDIVVLIIGLIYKV